MASLTGYWKPRPKAQATPTDAAAVSTTASPDPVVPNLANGTGDGTDDDAWSAPSLAPLAAFFTRRALPLPRLEILPPSSLPSPWRAMLDHTRNMTFVLGEYWAHQPVRLVVVEREEQREAGRLHRWIKLEVDENRHQDDTEFDALMAKAAAAPTAMAAASATPSLPPIAAVAPSATTFAPPTPPVPVEFGSIFIHVTNLPASLQPAVWAGQIPFATLLRNHSPPIEQTVQAQLFFAFDWTSELSCALAIDPSHGCVASQPMRVYGRTTLIRSALDERVLCEVVEVMPPRRVAD